MREEGMKTRALRRVLAAAAAVAPTAGARRPTPNPTKGNRAIECITRLGASLFPDTKPNRTKTNGATTRLMATNPILIVPPSESDSEKAAAYGK